MRPHLLRVLSSDRGRSPFDQWREESACAVALASMTELTGLDGEPDELLDAVHELLDRTVEGMGVRVLGAGLHSGVTWGAFVVEQLRERVYDGDTTDLVAAVDEALMQHAAQAGPDTEQDLVSGLTGHGVYALQRAWVTDAGRALVERLVHALAAEARWEGDACAWFRGPALLRPRGKRETPSGCYDLGLAHGIPGIAAFLAHAAEADVVPELARPLAEAAIRWMLLRERDASAPAAFDACLDHELRPVGEHSRLAWCYGDASVAIAALAVGRADRSGDAWEAGLRIARRAARVERRSSASGAWLCHGAAGLTLIFGRMFEETDEDEFADSARYWLHQTINRAHARIGPGNDVSLRLLAGLSGLTLALTTCLGAGSGWLSCMLLNSVAANARAAPIAEEFCAGEVGR